MHPSNSSNTNNSGSVLRVFGHLPVESILAPVKAESDTSSDSFERRIRNVNRAADQHLLQLKDKMVEQGMDPHKAEAAIAGYLSTDSGHGEAEEGGGGAFAMGEDDATFERRYREELRQLLLVLNRGKASTAMQQHGWRAEVDFGDPRAVIFEAPPQPQQQSNNSTQLSKKYPTPTTMSSSAAECEDDHFSASSPAPKFPTTTANRFPVRKSPVPTTTSAIQQSSSTPRYPYQQQHHGPATSASNGNISSYRPTNNGPTIRSATNSNLGSLQNVDEPVIVKSSMMNAPSSNHNKGTTVARSNNLNGTSKAAVVVDGGHHHQHHPFATMAGAPPTFGGADDLRPSAKYAARDSDLSVRTNQSEGAGNNNNNGGYLIKKGNLGGGPNSHQHHSNVAGEGGRTSVFTTPPAFKGL